MKNLFLILTLIYSTTVSGQIPNFSFEMWNTGTGYPDPTEWDNLNRMTYTTGVNTCLQGSPGSPGSYYLLLLTSNVPGKGVVPGKAVSGKIDTTTYQPVSGFPFSSRPAQLNYSMQYMPYSSTDPSNVSVWLTKWNTVTSTRDTVASGYTEYMGMAHSWFTSSTFLTYYNGDFPDTACIVVSSSDSVPMAGSYIYIDNFQFSGSVIGVQDTDNFDEAIAVFPNPAQNIVEIRLLTTTIGSLKAFNSIGECVINQNLVGGLNIIHLNGLQYGVYFFNIETSKKIYNKKIIIE